MVYLDSNAGAPLHPKVKEALSAFAGKNFSAFLGNASSRHSYGQKLKKLIHDVEVHLKKNIFDDAILDSNFSPFLFTSSGTEANQTVIRSVLEPYFRTDTQVHWIISPVEHDSNLQMVDWVRSKGGKISFAKIDSDGRPDPQSIFDLLTPQTRLVSTIWVNNETGVITDVDEVRKCIRNYEEKNPAQHSIHLHWDAAQAWGKIPILPNYAESRYHEWLSFSGHKIGALSGVGLLAAKESAWKSAWQTTSLPSLIRGKQQGGRRGGTENMMGVFSLGIAAKNIDTVAYQTQIEPLRDQLQHLIQKEIDGVSINGDGAPRVANTLSLSFERIKKTDLVAALDADGFAVSSGSACTTGVALPSHVLIAMGHTSQSALNSIRVSLHPENTWSELESFVYYLSKRIHRLRSYP